MILCTYVAPSGNYRLAKLSHDKSLLIDLQSVHEAVYLKPSMAFASMQSLIDAGEDALQLADRIDASQADAESHCLPLDSVRLASPLPRPMQIRDFSVFELHMRQAAVGVTRLRYARQQNDSPLPHPDDIPLPEAFLQQPIYYKANRFNVIGHEQDVIWPRHSEYLDYELELGIVLGRSGRDIPEERAHEHIFGYTIFNDFSARDTQEFEMTAPFGPAKGKDFDTGNVIGPWIVTRDELNDPYNLHMTAKVNGELWSEGNSNGMVHNFEQMIAHVSRDETLYAGEIFGSGTIGGGCGLEIDRWLRPGDTVELEVEGIGVLRNRVVQDYQAVG
jgi:2-keto-4-pentenoate hydratase/2-oxohepta-3-ene-1,7-dioic acid hydratase in catechol pathway